MYEQIVKYDVAKLAREKGFNEFTKFSIFRGTKDYIKKSKCSNSELSSFEYSSPTQSLLQKWLRDIHKLHIYIDTTPTFDVSQGSKYKAAIKVPFQPFKWTTAHYYLGDTYEEVLEIGLFESLKLIK